MTIQRKMEQESRDYIHVVDLANGHVKALEKVLSTTGVDAYNLGTGMGYSVLEMVEAFEKVSGKKVPYKITERRPGDVAVCFADASKAKRELGWGGNTRIRRNVQTLGNGNQIIKMDTWIVNYKKC